MFSGILAHGGYMWTLLNCVTYSHSAPLYSLLPELVTTNPRGPQQAEILDTDAEILDTDAEIRAEILLEIRDPKSQAILFPIISVKYVNLYHVNYNM